jgi:hypothetical protein
MLPLITLTDLSAKSTMSFPLLLEGRLVVSGVIYWSQCVCHGTSSPLTEGLGTSLYPPGYLSKRSHDLWIVYIAWPLWPFLASFPLHATTILHPAFP